MNINRLLERIPIRVQVGLVGLGGAFLFVFGFRIAAWWLRFWIAA